MEQTKHGLWRSWMIALVVGVLLVIALFAVPAIAASRDADGDGLPNRSERSTTQQDADGDGEANADETVRGDHDCPDRDGDGSDDGSDA
jgi:hypothetical protein